MRPQHSLSASAYTSACIYGDMVMDMNAIAGMNIQNMYATMNIAIIKKHKNGFS